MKNLDSFMQVYEKELVKAVMTYPENYAWPVENAPIVAAKMRVAFERGSYNKDGNAIKQTCKILGIPYTYAGINGYIKQVEVNNHA